MGAGGRDNDKESGEMTAPPPPAYQEKQPLPPDHPDPPADVEKQEPPVLVQHSPHQCKRRRRRCCCYCCTVLVVLILCCTVIPIAIVYMTRDYWGQPYVDMRFEGSSSRVTSQSVQAGESAVIQCHVDMTSRYVPLVQWFHDPNEAPEDDISGYRLFAVHNTINDAAYKNRFEVFKTETSGHRIVYNMIIRDIQPEDSGRYACQVPKAPRHGAEFTDEYQEGSRSSSSSSSSEDDDNRENRDHNDDKGHKGCWFKHRRNDYLYISVTK